MRVSCDVFCRSKATIRRIGSLMIDIESLEDCTDQTSTMFGKRQEIVGLWFEILKGISFKVFSFFRKPMPLAAKETWLFGRLDLSPLIIISLHLMNVVLPFLFNFPTYIYIYVFM